MTYIKIENGIVVQKQPHKQEGFIEVNVPVVCGMIANSDGTFSNPPVPTPTPEEILNDFMDQIEYWLDHVAAERGYKSMERLVGYVGDPVPLWDAEGQAGLTFRSAVWVKAIEIQEAVMAGKRSLPTIEEVIKEMPEIEWPEQ